MRKVSTAMPVLIAGIVFSFVAVFLLAQEKSATTQPAHRSLGEGGTTNQVAAAVEVGGQKSEDSTATPDVPEADNTNEEQRTKNEEQLTAPSVPATPPAKARNGKNGKNGGVVEITVSSKTGAPPESVETNGGSTGAAGANLITVAFDNVPVQDVVNMFAQISGANIIMAGSFTNLFITANLKNVEWKSALNLALGAVNLSMIEDASGILMVVTSEMYPQKLQEIEASKPLVIRTIVPKYLNAVDLVEQIKLFKVLSPRGSITTSQSAKQDVFNLKSSETKTPLTIQNPSISTAIVITDIKEYVDKVAALIQALDKREYQVFIEARIINVASSDSKKLGFDWSVLDSFSVAAGLNKLAWDFSNVHSVDNSNVKTRDQQDNRENVDTVNQSSETPSTRTVADTINRHDNISAIRTDTLTDTLTENTTAAAFLTIPQVQLVMSALEKNNNAEMISHPQIVVGNRVEAKIHVGEKYPVLPTITDMLPSGSSYIAKYSDGPEIILELGLTLWVIPEIDFHNNTIRLTVRPETATQSGEVKNPLTGKTYPIVLSRDLTTRVNVPSGHTVAIGGLVENRTSKIEKKVPILGDIPLLGLLFRHTEDAVSKNNLIILITPTILDDSKPLTGMEAVAKQTIDKYEKTPLAAVKAVPSNTVAGVTIGTNAVTPAAGMGRQAPVSVASPPAAVTNAPAAPPVTPAASPEK